jgi:O-antigen/teichoic acid export membrane protein
MLLIRYMPKKEYALYTFALSLVAFVTQSLSATFNRVYVLAGPNPRIKGTEWSSLGFQLCLICLLVLLGLPLLSTLGSLYWLVAILVSASCFSEFAKTYFQKELGFLRFSLIELSRSLLFFGATLLLLSMFRSAVSARQVALIQALALSTASWLALRKHLPVWKATNRQEIATFAQSIVSGPYSFLFGYFFVMGIFTQADIFMLKAIGTDEMLANYGSAYRYYGIMSLALGSIHAVLLPMIQRSSSHQELAGIFAKNRPVILVFVCGVAVAGFLSKWFIPVIDMGKYPQAVMIFRILCVSAIISFTLSPYVNVVMRFERFRFLLWLVLLALGTSVLLNLQLIPRFGAIGVAIATLLSAAILNVGTYAMYRKLTNSEVFLGD